MSFIKTTSIAGLVKLGIIVAALLYAALFIMTAGHPVIEAHSFRQTQTAISVFYMLSGEGLFNYITPVTGAPWTIPFEAPVYHISVALLSQISPFSLDTNGRIVSAIYWAGCLFFGYKIFRLALPEKPLTAAIFVLLALCSPLYIFWSRTFMIETSTLFFGFVFLYAVMRFTAEGRYWLVGLAVISGVLCILAKATTWPAFVVAGGVYFLSYNMKFLVSFRPANIARPDTLRFIARGCLLLLAVLIALWVGLSWTHHSDAMKLQTHFGEGLTSGALSAWNFGTGADRLSGQFWNATVMERALPEAIGLFWFIPIFGLAGLFISKDRDRIFSKEIALIAIGTALFLLPMLIFTNLHMVHNYYQVGSSIFIIAVVAVIIGAMLTSSRMTQILGVFTIVMILIGQVFVFLTGYFPRMNSPEIYAGTAQHQMALLAKKHVPEGTAVLSTGLNWSSHLHYYAERKGVALPLAWDIDKIQQMAEKPELVFGDMAVGGIVQCEDPAETALYPKAAELAQQLVDKLRADPASTWMTIDLQNCHLAYRTDR